MGRVRLLDTNPVAKTRGTSGLRKWLAVADAPLSRYGENTINSRLSDLDWVSRAAVAHEAVVEAFIDSAAVLPMKLFTIFTTDERALAHLHGEERRIDAMLKRVANHREWGCASSPIARGQRSASERLSAKAARGAVRDWISFAEESPARRGCPTG